MKLVHTISFVAATYIGLYHQLETHEWSIQYSSQHALLLAGGKLQ